MEYIKKTKPKRSKKAKIFVWLLVVFVVLGIALWYMYAVVNPVIVQTSEAKIKSLAQHTLTNAVLSVVSTNDVFNNLIKYQYNDRYSSTI